MQRQRALTGQRAMSTSNGRQYVLKQATEPGKREYQLCVDIPELDHLQPALERFFDGAPCPAIIQLQLTLGVLRYEGVADIVRPHHKVFGRKCALELSSVAVHTTREQKGKEVTSTMYAQVSH
jgi:hypothetical protein